MQEKFGFKKVSTQDTLVKTEQNKEELVRTDH